MSCRSRNSTSSASGVTRQLSQRSTGRRGNFVGKLTQSVRRIVKEVKEDPVDTGQSRDEMIHMNERLRLVRERLDTSLSVAKVALLDMHKKYDDSQEIRSPVARYKLRKAMIKEVVRLETQYWSLVEIPVQERGESMAAFVSRAYTVLERTTPKETSQEQADEEKLDRIDRLDGLTASQIDQENNRLTAELFRQLKKYLALRQLIKQLTSEYHNSKLVPVMARYFMLGDMVRRVLNDPEYIRLYSSC